MTNSLPRFLGAIGGGTLAALAPTVLMSQELQEWIEVYPTGLNRIGVKNPKGDVDKRKSVPDAKGGVLWVGLGDLLEVSLEAPSEIKGMMGTCNLKYSIREEYERNCKKHIIHHPRRPPVIFGTDLTVGQNVHIQVILESLDDPQMNVTRELKLGTNPPIEVNSGANVRVKFSFKEEDVLFEARNTLTKAEEARFIQPKLAAVRRNPNVELANPPYENVRLGPGNVGEIKVKLTALRKKR